MTFHQPPELRMPSSITSRRIVLTTLGSLGDLHPYLAIALGLKARGHEAVVVTGECYRSTVESLGLEFRPLRPDSRFVADPRVMRRLMDFRWGTVRAIREVVLPSLRQSYDDTLAAVAAGADLVVSHPLTFATRLVAEKRGIAWASTQITPLGLCSVHDLPSLPVLPDLSERFRDLGPRFWGPLRQFLTWATRAWAGPLVRLRSEIGLPRARDNPLVDGHSPSLVLALFSPILAARQIDWPPQAIHTGFPIHDQAAEAGMPTELARFLDDGPPPIVFTLSVTATMVAGSFFEQSVIAARRLGRRAVLVTGSAPGGLPVPKNEDVIFCKYVPFSDLFARAAAIVHAGGIGTTGLGMRAGRPTLVVPHAHDQPDNAARLARLGLSRTLSPRRYTAARVESELRSLLDDPGYARKAAEIGERVRQEDGARAACDALEARLPR